MVLPALAAPFLTSKAMLIGGGLLTGQSLLNTWLKHRKGSRELDLKGRELDLMMKETENKKGDTKAIYEAMMKMGKDQQGMLLNLRKEDRAEGKENMMLQYMMQAPEKRMQMMMAMQGMMMQANNQGPAPRPRYQQPMGMSGLMQL